MSPSLAVDSAEADLDVVGCLTHRGMVAYLPGATLLYFTVREAALNPLVEDLQDRSQSGRRQECVELYYVGVAVSHPDVTPSPPTTPTPSTNRDSLVHLTPGELLGV